LFFEEKSPRIIPYGKIFVLFRSQNPGGKMYLINPNAKIVKSAEDIGEIVRKKRKDQGLTQAQVAEYSGLSVRLISEVERGKKTAEIGKVLFLLEILGVDLIADPRD
jgi:y4mF family transcriptional regulator